MLANEMFYGFSWIDSHTEPCSRRTWLQKEIVKKKRQSRKRLSFFKLRWMEPRLLGYSLRCARVNPAAEDLCKIARQWSARRHFFERHSFFFDQCQVLNYVFVSFEIKAASVSARFAVAPETFRGENIFIHISPIYNRSARLSRCCW